MSDATAPRPQVAALLSAVAVTLTLTTAYVHLTLGSTIFTLNAAGYLGFAALLTVGTTVRHPIVARFAWLPRVGVAAYAAVTIVSYLIVGPYFALGWVTKGVEIALIGVVAADLIGAYGGAGAVISAAARSVRPEGRTS